MQQQHLWQCEFVTMWPCEFLTMWQCDNVTKWQCEFLTMWQCDNLTKSDVSLVWCIKCVSSMVHQKKRGMQQSLIHTVNFTASTAAALSFSISQLCSSSSSKQASYFSFVHFKLVAMVTNAIFLQFYISILTLWKLLSLYLSFCCRNTSPDTCLAKTLWVPKMWSQNWSFRCSLNVFWPITNSVHQFFSCFRRCALASGDNNVG